MTISTPTDTYEADFAQTVQQMIYYYTRALLRLERTIHLLEGRGGEGRGGEGRDDGYTYCNRYVH